MIAKALDFVCEREPSRRIVERVCLVFQMIGGLRLSQRFGRHRPVIVNSLLRWQRFDGSGQTMLPAVAGTLNDAGSSNEPARAPMVPGLTPLWTRPRFFWDNRRSDTTGRRQAELERGRTVRKT